MSQHLIKTHSQVSIIHDEFVKCKRELLSVHTFESTCQVFVLFFFERLQGLSLYSLCFPDSSEINCSKSTKLLSIHDEFVVICH